MVTRLKRCGTQGLLVRTTNGDDPEDVYCYQWRYRNWWSQYKRDMIYELEIKRRLGGYPEENILQHEQRIKEHEDKEDLYQLFGLNMRWEDRPLRSDKVVKKVWTR